MVQLYSLMHDIYEKGANYRTIIQHVLCVCVFGSQGGLRRGQPRAGTTSSPAAGANAGAVAGGGVPKPQCGGEGQAPAHQQEHGTCPTDLSDEVIKNVIFTKQKNNVYLVFRFTNLYYVERGIKKTDLSSI